MPKPFLALFHALVLWFLVGLLAPSAAPARVRCGVDRGPALREEVEQADVVVLERRLV
jgi:hypothetical protein